MTLPITYIRSSSANTFRMCEQKYFLEYVLGWQSKSNKAADKGTICHKVFEICALAAKAKQEGIGYITDDIVGKVIVDNYEPEYLEQIIHKVYGYYTKAYNHHDWTNKDLKDCIAWVWKGLKYNNGMFDPRYRTIIDAEPHFDIELPYEWAKYQYELNGKTYTGQVSIKGTIDLVTDIGNGICEIIDYKTGQTRKDWATGEEKTEAKLYQDIQLRMYHYAASKLFPQFKTFLVTIIFINAGGPFTLHFNEEDLVQTEILLQKIINVIQNRDKPKLVRHVRPKNAWQCSRLCHFGKNCFNEQTQNIVPLIEKRSGQVTKFGEPQTMCEQVSFMIDKYGVQWAIDNMMNPVFTIGKYKDPGSAE